MLNWQALTFFWIVYAAFEENNPKRGGSDKRIHRRCALLLLHLEQCVVYGCGVRSARSQDVEQLLKDCVQVRCLAPIACCTARKAAHLLAIFAAASTHTPP